MAIRGAEYAVARVIAVLKSALGTELDLIDTEEGDGLTLADVASADYYDAEFEDGHVVNYPAIVVDAKATRTLGVTSSTVSPGIIEAEHDIEVTILMTNSENESRGRMKKRSMRYGKAVERVLVVKNPALPLAGVETVVRIRREEAGDMRYLDDQQDDRYIRSTTVPFIVQTYEQL